VEVSWGSGSCLLAGLSHQNFPPSGQISSQLPEISAQCRSESEAGIEFRKTMKAKHLSLAIEVLLVVGGLWFARSARRTRASHEASMDAGMQTPGGPPKPGQMLRPPNPAQRFMDFTPEQRVEFARRGSGPGG